MENNIRTLALFVDSDSAQFDSVGLYELLTKISSGIVWNFITGAYVFKTDRKPSDVSRLLGEEAFPTHVVLEFDPAKASGVLPVKAWESWFGDLFYDDRHEISRAKGWDPEVIEQVRNKKAD